MEKIGHIRTALGRGNRGAGRELARIMVVSRSYHGRIMFAQLAEMKRGWIVLGVLMMWLCLSPMRTRAQETAEGFSVKGTVYVHGIFDDIEYYCMFCKVSLSQGDSVIYMGCADLYGNFALQNVQPGEYVFRATGFGDTPMRLETIFPVRVSRELKLRHITIEDPYHPVYMEKVTSPYDYYMKQNEGNVITICPNAKK